MTRHRALAVLGAAIAVGAAVASTGLTAASEEKARRASTVFAVRGMTCGGCEAGVKVAVRKLEGVLSVTASYRGGRATVTYDPSRVSVEAIRKAIEKIGYEARPLEEGAGP